MKKLSLIEKAFYLKKTTLFGFLDLDLLLTISDKLDSIQHKSGEQVFLLDQHTLRMYFIVDGHVLIQDKKGVFLEELSSGDFFGDEALFNERPRGYEASCKTSVSLLALSKSHFLGILNECPSVSICLLEAYSRALDFRQRQLQVERGPSL